MTRPKPDKPFKCNECGKRMTIGEAKKAMFSARGCTKCGGSDVDLSDEAFDNEREIV